MKKLFALTLAALMLLTCFAGCSKAETDSDLQYIQDKGKLVVGITDYAPMDFKDADGNWTGFDAEFATLFAEELGVDVEFFVLADWGTKFFELKDKNIDCIWIGMTISEEVKNNTSCSNPYVKNAQVVVMKADVAGNYTTKESLADVAFAAEIESTGAGALEDMGIADYVQTTDMAGALMEVSAGTSDACVIDITMAGAMIGEGTSYTDLTVAMELNSEEYGVGFRQGSDVTAKFNAFMAELMADGTLDALAQKYNLTLVK